MQLPFEFKTAIQESLLKLSVVFLPRNSAKVEKLEKKGGISLLDFQIQIKER